MKHLSLLLLGCLLLLSSGRAWAYNPVAGVTVQPNTTQTIPNAGQNNYYDFLVVQSGARAIIAQSTTVYVRALTVRSGGTLELSQGGYVYAAVTNGSGTNTPRADVSVTLEPGATVESKFINQFNGAGGISIYNYPASAYTVSPLANFIFRSTSGFTQSSSDVTGYFMRLPAQVGTLTIDNPAGFSLTNNTRVNQVLHLTSGTLTVATGATLTLASDVNGAATLDAMPRSGASSSLVGAVAVQHYVRATTSFTAAAYHHLAAPVSGATVASFANAAFTPVVNPAYNTAAQPNLVTPYPTVFDYDQSRVGAAGVAGTVGFNQGWRSPAALTDALEEGRGYTVHTPANQVITYTGTARTGDAQINFDGRGPAADAGYQLAGNPYAAPLNWDLVNAANLFNGPEPTLYVFNATGPYAGYYSSYLPNAGGSGGIGTNGGSSVVPSGQGFFVRMRANVGNGVLTFAQNQTIPTYYEVVPRPAADPRAQLRLSLRNAAGQAHETVVYFDATATPGVDAATDAAYLPGPGQQLALRTEAAGQPLAINGQPLLTGADVRLPLHLSATAAGSYSLNVDNLANLPAAYHAYLQDALTGTYTDLATTPSLALTLAANTDDAGRYALLFTTQARVLAAAPAALAVLVSLYPNPAHGTATLLLPQALRGPSATPVEILNSLGQVVRRAQQPAAAATLELSLDGLAAGLYTVRAHTTAGTVSRRLTVE